MKLYRRGRFPISQNFGWKFLQLPLSNGKDFFSSHSKLAISCSLVDQKTYGWHNNGAIGRQQTDGNENFVQMKHVFWRKEWSTSKGRLLYHLFSTG